MKEFVNTRQICIMDFVSKHSFAIEADLEVPTTEKIHWQLPSAADTDTTGFDQLLWSKIAVLY